MNIVKNIEQYNENYVYFCEPIKNNIMNDGNFIRILYSTPLFILNGIYIKLNISYLSIEKYYNKFKYTFDIIQFKDIIEKLRLIEENLLIKSNINGKIPLYKIYEQLKNGNIKVFSENFDKHNTILLLKIAGIWETDSEYGLTYKFIMI
jgi:hypothetical protein